MNPDLQAAALELLDALQELADDALFVRSLPAYDPASEPDAGPVVERMHFDPSTFLTATCVSYRGTGPIATRFVTQATAHLDQTVHDGVRPPDRFWFKFRDRFGDDECDR